MMQHQYVSRKHEFRNILDVSILQLNPESIAYVTKYSVVFYILLIRRVYTRLRIHIILQLLAGLRFVRFLLYVVFRGVIYT